MRLSAHLRFLTVVATIIAICNARSLREHSLKLRRKREPVTDLITAEWMALAAQDLDGRKPDECAEIACGMLNYEEIGRRKRAPSRRDTNRKLSKRHAIRSSRDVSDRVRRHKLVSSKLKKLNVGGT